MEQPERKLEDALIALENNISELVTELSKAREENTVLKIKLAKQEELIKDFQNKSKITKIVNGIGPIGEDADKLKERIEENIQIIDKCITQLGRNKLDI